MYGCGTKDNVKVFCDMMLWGRLNIKVPYIRGMPGLQFDESFELPVEYDGKELLLPAKLVRRGYGYKIHVEVDKQEVIFEPDEERNWRAIMDNAPNAKNISTGIMQAIVESIEKHLR